MNFAPNNRRVGIVGLGLSGIAAARFLLERGHKILAWDQNPRKGAELARHPLVTLEHGPNPAEALSQCEAILLSPGIPRSHPCLAQALAAKVAVINDVEWLYQHSQKQKNPGQFIGITGTNGKSTVTTLVGLMLESSGLVSQTGGNLGQAALSLWQDNIEKYVLELSSFQLESLPGFHAQTAALLNISPDHLDRYIDLDDYITAKLNIFANQTPGDFAVINVDDPLVVAAYEKIAKQSVQMVPFSTSGPVDGGFALRDGLLLDCREKTAQTLLAVDQLKITGIHNQANALAAAAIALCAGASQQAVISTLQSFPGLPHRMEWIRTLDDVAYYNDSKGTNVGAVQQSLASFPEKLVLIAGGRDKNSDFSPLKELIGKHVASLVLIGESATTMARLFAGCCNIERADSMEHAVAVARQLAQPGATVLLSPACASFDMFNNFEDRGDQFRKVVHEL